ncbi:MAG TPA: AMP-binding protein, partial [Lacipirellulaceae bacterium]|nr:AMP-binding protein [Lacipirellulaceae bacterium]
VFFVCGVLTLPVLIYIVVLIPQATIRFLAWLVTHTFYRVRVHGREHVPEEGPALLAPNHVSWLDGLLLVAVSARPVRIIVTNNLLASRWARGLARVMGAIPLHSGPKAVRSTLDAARDALAAGDLVCIFPEGNITRSGQLQSFKPGVLRIVKGTDAPIVPVYLDELWGSIFSFAGGKFFWKWPGPGGSRVSIWFGAPLDRPKDVYEVRNAVQRLSAQAVSGRKNRTMVLPRTMIRKCRKARFRWKVADSSDQSLTGGQLLLRSLILRRLLLRRVLAADEKYVGVLLPPSCGGVVVNAALALSGRVAANLNYTVSAEVMNKCIAKAGIRHVLTSRRVMDKLQMKLDAEVVLLEDFKDHVTRADKLAGALLAFATPAMLVDRILGLHRLSGEDELTVIFTSGSTGEPKGVVLTQHNIGSNVEAIDQVVHLRPDDVIMGIVPFFHSLGYTVTLWAVLGLDVRAAYHFSPLEAQQVGKLAKKWDATVLLATPTFLRNYLRRCDVEDFARLEIAVAGAEKLPIPLCDAFEEKFGVRPVEGYGTTELSPLVSVNVPPSRSQSGELELKEGSVGKPVPGVAAKVVDPDTFAELPIDTPGMLLVTGPNVMKGYLHEPEKTAEVVRDGWYVTGDIARIDKHGFIEITGRLSRFSKIGGEMVPHLNVEEAIQHFLQGDNQDELLAVVTSVPDERKGERLAVVHKAIARTPSEICEHLQQLGLPNLWIPDAASFLQVEEIPVLGTGKLDLKGLSDVARKHFGG